MPKLKAKHQRQIEKSIDKLNLTMQEIQEYIPDANYYLEDSWNFHVISGDSHDETGQARKDRVMSHHILIDGSGGAW